MCNEISRIKDIYASMDVEIVILDSGLLLNVLLGNRVVGARGLFRTYFKIIYIGLLNYLLCFICDFTPVSSDWNM